MSIVPPGLDKTALYKAARGVLLDGLAALEPHLDAVVVVGAQAVYLRSQDADLKVAAFTSDADLSINPSLLGDDPKLEEAMRNAGFALLMPSPNHTEPGTWIRSVVVGDKIADIAVDLLIPETVAGNARRSVQIPPHDKTAARKSPGLEACLVDNDPMLIASLEPDSDSRQFTVQVAGVAALLIAKAHKISDRLDNIEKRPDKLDDKDAGDVVRLMTTHPAATAANTFAVLSTDEIAGETTITGMETLRAQFGRPAAPGVEMAVRALAGGALAADRIRALCPAYISRALRLR